MEKILITGGCGFIGSNLAVMFLERGYHVTCFDNLSRSGSEKLLKRVLDCGCEYVHGDIRVAEDFEKLHPSYDVMIECSAEPSVLVGSRGTDAKYIIDSNLLGAVNCFEYCRRRGTPILFLSSSRVYPYDRINSLKFVETDTRFELAEGSEGVRPQGISLEFPLDGLRTLYGATKLCCEVLLREYSANFGIPVVVDRCSVVAGPWQLGRVDQGVFTHWLVSHLYKKDLEYIGFGGTGKQVRDLLHIDDLGELILKQIKVVRQQKFAVFNVGGSVTSNLSLCEASRLCSEITGNKISVGSSLANRAGDIAWYVSDNAQVEKAYNWKPRRTARDVLQDTYKWLMAHENQFKDLFGGG